MRAKLRPVPSHVPDCAGSLIPSPAIAPLILHDLLQPTASLGRVLLRRHDLHLQAARVRQRALRIDAQQLTHAPQQILRRHRPLRHLFALRVRRANHLTAKNLRTLQRKSGKAKEFNAACHALKLKDVDKVRNVLAQHARFEVAVKEAAGQVKVIAGTGSNSTDEAIALTRHAKKVGADGALLVSPYYNKPTQEGLYRHFKAVAEAVDIPIVVYNIQGRTGVNIANETMKRLSQIPNIVGVKEASGSILQISEVIGLCGPDFDVLSGDDQMTFPLMALGGKGVISVITNIAPARVSEMVRYMLAGKSEQARSVHFDIYELFQTMFIETNPIPVKFALGLMGKIVPEYRLPLCPPSEANGEKIKKVVEKYGLI